MKKQDVLEILRAVESGRLGAEEAFTKLKLAPFEDIGFAKVDHHREMRQGVAEVIYGAGKTPEQIAKISAALMAGGDRVVLITRMAPEAAEYVGEKFPLVYDSLSKVGRIGENPEPDGVGVGARRHRRDDGHPRRRGGGAHRRGAWQPREAALRRRRLGHTPPARPRGGHHDGALHRRRRGHGGRAAERHRRPCGLPCHRRADQRGLRRGLRRRGGPALACSTPAPAGSRS